MSDNKSKYEMTIDLNVLNHLGINLYSNIPSVISEVVANAWDADAEEVNIHIDVEKDEIVITDDGHGMSLSDINDKYLTVGYRKRENNEIITPKHKRSVMGRKGIGKLSLFSIADKISVFSATKKGDRNGLLLDSNEIKEQISTKSKNPYLPQDLSCEDFHLKKGTKIVLNELKKNIGQTSRHLKKRLARRFSIMGSKNSFLVKIDGSEIKVEDRDYFHKIQYLWYYGEESKEYLTLAKNAEQIEKRENVINSESKITGWIGLVKESNQLQDEYDNLNKIPILIRGKVSQENILEEYREGSLYIKYIFGEIRADFLDDDDLPDIATSSRQGVIEHDKRYSNLKKFINDELKHIQKKRIKFKGKEAEKEALKNVDIEIWYKKLGKDSKKKAKALFAKINQITVDDNNRNTLFSHAVIAFESLRYKDALDALENVSVENIGEFVSVFKNFDDIEASLYYQITKQRIEVLEKFQVHVHDDNALEKILQEFLFNHLWLLDPSWDRATEHPYMEKQISSEFEKIDAGLTEEEAKGRVDIKYKKASGKHIIIELKRASVVTNVYALQEQVDKYKSGLRKLLEEKNENNPVIECVCIVGKPLKGWSDSRTKESDIQMMATKNTRLVTYQELIKDSYNQYEEYMSSNTNESDTLELIKKLSEDE
ncbi:ATP-binding protein [Maribacter sp. Asnod1-A12]|uniref:BbrUII/HgiDII family restriction enzyme n=1 Tax=Maribacter sp. Asnod1-A12 TaxID=3160576 RepID=UPI003869DF8B